MNTSEILFLFCVAYEPRRTAIVEIMSGPMNREKKSTAILIDPFAEKLPISTPVENVLPVSEVSKKHIVDKAAAVPKISD